MSGRFGTEKGYWYAACLLRGVQQSLVLMKTKLYTLLLLTLISADLFAGPRNLITAKVNNGNWSNPSTWSSGSVPQNGDSIVIPSGFTVIVDNSYTLNNVFVAIS